MYYLTFEELHQINLLLNLQLANENEVKLNAEEF